MVDYHRVDPGDFIVTNSYMIHFHDYYCKMSALEKTEDMCAKVYNLLIQSEFQLTKQILLKNPEG